MVSVHSALGRGAVAQGANDADAGSSRPANVRRLLREIAAEYPAELRASQHADIDRVVFQCELVEPLRQPGAVLCDLGSGVGMFGICCHDLGWQVTCIDDFHDPVNVQLGDAALAVHRRHGVRVVNADVLSAMPDLGDETVDVFTCFDSMEHWHSSPRGLLHALLRMLKPRGMLLLATPNCVNLRKRITVPFGHGKWSSMSSWYNADRFRCHVREPDVDDLLYIARDLNLVDVRVIGRNWGGISSRSRIIALTARATDSLLRPFPTLCSDLYLSGRKPA